MHSALNAPHLQSEAAAFEYVEAQLWPNGPVCPFCGYGDRVGRLKGQTTRVGLCKCYSCKKPFTVRMGTIFESSHLALHLWLQIIHLMCASKKGISTRQIQRMLDCSMKTAWFLGHRIREAMKDNGGMIGGFGKTVEADETYLSKSPKTRKPAGTALNAKPAPMVFALVERGGNIRSMYLDHRNVRSAVYKHLHEDSRLVTDGSNTYRFIMATPAQHESVDHSKREWVRGDVHTNTLEGYFSIFKRGLVGIYQHMDKKHLNRYLAEFDFRMNTRAKFGVDDAQRAEIALQGVKGKRLTYKTAGAKSALSNN
jgi:transposase-like protein